MDKLQQIDINYLYDILDYNMFTGVFRWKQDRRGSAKAGSIAGYKSALGYITIRIDGVQYKAHRLAWYYMWNEIPNIIDHMDRNPSNNSIFNLRNGTQYDNMQNRSKPKNNKSGYTGIRFDESRNKWYSTIQINKKRTFLGYFDNLDDAIKARKDAEKYK